MFFFKVDKIHEWAWIIGACGLGGLLVFVPGFQVCPERHSNASAHGRLNIYFEFWKRIVVLVGSLEGVAKYLLATSPLPLLSICG